MTMAKNNVTQYSSIRFECEEEMQVGEWTWVIKQWANGSSPRLVQAFQQVCLLTNLLTICSISSILNLKVRPREYSGEEVAIIMQDQDMAGNPEIMRILEEKQMMKDCLDPRVRYFPTSNIDLCDNVDDKGNFCAGLMVHKREKIATEIVLISLESFKDIIPGINNCVRIESQVPTLT